VHVADAQTFAAFDQPDYEKWCRASASRVVTRPGDTCSSRSTEHALSPSARRKFAAYWVVIGPASRVLLDMLLRAEARAEHTAPQWDSTGRNRRAITSEHSGGP
jgi:hypothetical protein